MLMEVLVAMAVLAMITTLIWGSITRSTEAMELAEKIESKYSQLRSAMSRMTREISMAYLSLHMSSDRRTQTLFQGKNTNPVDSLLFSSMAHQRLTGNVHESDLSYIKYYGEPNKDNPGKTSLMRAEKPRIDDKPDEEIQGEVLAEDVVGVEFKYWDDMNQSWVDEWDSVAIEKANRIPRIVQISMTILDETGKELTITTKTKVVMDKVQGF